MPKNKIGRTLLKLVKRGGQHKLLSMQKLVFIDETWAKTNMTRTYGRGLRGNRVREKVPNAQWETTRFLGAMRSSGFIAPLCIDGPINSDIFTCWVEQHLIKELQSGDIVILDNLSSHTSTRALKAIESVGAELRFLPAYSPDLNPIELAFSKFKKLLRDGATLNGNSLETLRQPSIYLPEPSAATSLSTAGTDTLKKRSL